MLNNVFFFANFKYIRNSVPVSVRVFCVSVRGIALGNRYLVFELRTARGQLDYHIFNRVKKYSILRIKH